MLDYQPADLTATVEGGLTLAGMQRELAGGGKFVPLESPLPERATIGGILAANVSGPLRYAYGLPRDWLIGVSVIDAEGIETKAGRASGQKCYRLRPEQTLYRLLGNFGRNCGGYFQAGSWARKLGRP